MAVEEDRYSEEYVELTAVVSKYSASDQISFKILRHPDHDFVVPELKKMLLNSTNPGFPYKAVNLNDHILNLSYLLRAQACADDDRHPCPAGLSPDSARDLTDVFRALDLATSAWVHYENAERMSAHAAHAVLEAESSLRDMGFSLKDEYVDINMIRKIVVVPFLDLCPFSSPLKKRFEKERTTFQTAFL